MLGRRAGVGCLGRNLADTRLLAGSDLADTRLLAGRDLGFAVCASRGRKRIGLWVGLRLGLDLGLRLGLGLGVGVVGAPCNLHQEPTAQTPEKRNGVRVLVSALELGRDPRGGRVVWGQPVERDLERVAGEAVLEGGKLAVLEKISDDRFGIAHQTGRPPDLLDEKGLESDPNRCARLTRVNQPVLEPLLVEHVSVVERPLQPLEHSLPRTCGREAVRSHVKGVERIGRLNDLVDREKGIVASHENDDRSVPLERLNIDALRTRLTLIHALEVGEDQIFRDLLALGSQDQRLPQERAVVDLLDIPMTTTDETVEGHGLSLRRRDLDADGPADRSIDLLHPVEGSVLASALLAAVDHVVPSEDENLVEQVERQELERLSGLLGCVEDTHEGTCPLVQTVLAGLLDVRDAQHIPGVQLHPADVRDVDKGADADVRDTVHPLGSLKPDLDNPRDVRFAPVGVPQIDTPLCPAGARSLGIVRSKRCHAVGVEADSAQEKVLPENGQSVSGSFTARNPCPETGYEVLNVENRTGHLALLIAAHGGSWVSTISRTRSACAIRV